VENNTPRENKWSNYLRQQVPHHRLVLLLSFDPLGGQAQEAEEEEDDDTPFTTCFPDYQPMSKKRRTTATAATTGDSFAAHARGRGRFGRGRGWRGCVAGIRSSSQDTDGHYSSPSHADDTRQLNGRGGNGGKHSATRWSYRPSVTIKGFGKGGPSMDQASTNTLILQREISTEDNEKQDEARSIPLSQTTLHLKAAPKSSYVMLASPGSASALPASQSLTPSSRSSSCLGSRWSAYQNQDQEDDQDEETSAPKSRLGNGGNILIFGRRWPPDLRISSFSGGLKRPTLDLRLFSTSSISFGDDEVVEEERM